MPGEAVFDQAYLSHENNIAQKQRTADRPERVKSIAEVRERYDAFRAALDFSPTLGGDFTGIIDELNSYVDFTKTMEKSDSFYNWRSDFAGSVIPEFLYCLFKYCLSSHGLGPLFSTRRSVVEVTLSGEQDGGWHIRHKNQDLCLGLRTDELSVGGERHEFVVPVVVFEVKTNIDINKLNGLDFSAERLKRTFPSAKYFLVTETVDFSLSDNYAAGYVDEIFVMRKQMRSVARRKKDPLAPEVFSALTADVLRCAKLAGEALGHVYDRLDNGRLIQNDTV